jgi:hypothetical protein
MGDDLSDDQILYLVSQTDAELFNAGTDIKQRQWLVPQQACNAWVTSVLS